MFRDQLISIAGEEHVLIGDAIEKSYMHDHSLLRGNSLEALVKPGSLGETTAILRLCHEHRVALTIRGGGTGVTGGAVPLQGGVVLSCERLNRIISIDAANRYATVEAGVVTQTFCDALEAEGLYYPVVPGSKGSSFIGGNLAMNAGSPRSCKYGSTADQVLNLEVALATGEVIRTGADVYKNVAGLDLTRLFIGSEGVLGIITKAVVKIFPLPARRRLFLAGFRELKSACDACLLIARSPLRPSAVELMTEKAIRLTAPYVPSGYPMIKPDIRAQLLVEIELEHADGECFGDDHAGELLEASGAVDVAVGETAQERELLWGLRGRIDVAMTSVGWSYRDIDTCVPPARLYDYLQEVEKIGNAHGQSLITFGHAMDGNMHTMLLFKDCKVSGGIACGNPFAEMTPLLTELYTIAIRMGGTITGEHGIGALQREFLPLQFSPIELELMRRIKTAFDPYSILNPGKFF
jgi:glycolate oxidase